MSSQTYRRVSLTAPSPWPALPSPAAVLGLCTRTLYTLVLSSLLSGRFRVTRSERALGIVKSEELEGIILFLMISH